MRQTTPMRSFDRTFNRYLVFVFMVLIGPLCFGKTDLVKLLPPDVHAFAYLNDVERLYAEFQQTSIGLMMQDPASREPVAKVKEKLEQLIHDLGGPIKELDGLFEGNLCFAWGRKSELLEEPFAVLLIETKTPEIAEHLAAQISSRLKSSNKEIARGRFNDIVTYYAEDGFGTPAYFANDRLFCLTLNSKSTIKRVARNRMDDESTDTLAHSDAWAPHSNHFRQFIQNPSSDLYLWFENPAAWVKTFQSLLADDPLIPRPDGKAPVVSDLVPFFAGDVLSIGAQVPVLAGQYDAKPEAVFHMVPEDEQTGAFSMLSDVALRQHPKGLMTNNSHMEISASWKPEKWINMANLVFDSKAKSAGLENKSFESTFGKNFREQNLDLNQDLFQHLAPQVNGLMYAQPGQDVAGALWRFFNGKFESAFFAFEVKNPRAVSEFLQRFATSGIVTTSKFRERVSDSTYWTIEDRSSVFFAKRRLVFSPRFWNTDEFIRDMNKTKQQWPSFDQLPEWEPELYNDPSQTMIARGRMDLKTVFSFLSVLKFIHDMAHHMRSEEPANETAEPISGLTKYLGDVGFELTRVKDQDRTILFHSFIRPPKLAQP